MIIKLTYKDKSVKSNNLKLDGILDSFFRSDERVIIMLVHLTYRYSINVTYVWIVTYKQL